jgi:hypothetical protein
MRDVIAAAKELRDAADRFIRLHAKEQARVAPVPRQIADPASAAALARVEAAWEREHGVEPLRTPSLLTLAPEHPLAAALVVAGGRPLRTYCPVGLGLLLGRLARLPGSRLQRQHTTSGTFWRLAPRP